MVKSIKAYKIKLGILIHEEKLSNGKPIFVAHCDALEVTSQGHTVEEANKNIMEAINIKIEECPEELERFMESSEPFFKIVEVPGNAKTSQLVGQGAC